LSLSWLGGGSLAWVWGGGRRWRGTLRVDQFLEGTEEVKELAARGLVGVALGRFGGGEDIAEFLEYFPGPFAQLRDAPGGAEEDAGEGGVIDFGLGIAEGSGDADELGELDVG
jgi:hypothetical protein